MIVFVYFYILLRFLINIRVIIYTELYNSKDFYIIKASSSEEKLPDEGSKKRKISEDELLEDSVPQESDSSESLDDETKELIDLKKAEM